MTTKKSEVQKAATIAAKDFQNGSRGASWGFITMHDELVDAACMDQVRAAWYTGGVITPDQIFEFRRAFIAAIKKLGFDVSCVRGQSTGT